MKQINIKLSKSSRNIRNRVCQSTRPYTQNILWQYSKRNESESGSKQICMSLWGEYEKEKNGDARSIRDTMTSYASNNMEFSCSMSRIQSYIVTIKVSMANIREINNNAIIEWTMIGIPIN